MNAWQKNFICSIALSLLPVCVASARADAQFSGTAEHVVLRAKNATMAEILSGIRSAFNTRVELTGSTEQQFTGAYAGTLRRVLSRLLDRENYVISSSPDGINIVLFGPKGPGRSAPVKSADAGPKIRLALVSEDEGNPNYQGWMPDRTLRKTASVQDTPSGDINSATTPAASSTEDEGNPNYQGWLPVRNPPKPASVQAAPSEGNSPAAAPAASSTENEGNPNYQGWIPAGNPLTVSRQGCLQKRY